MGISPSIGVEFDTWDNPEFGDPTSSDHAAIVTNGDGDTHLETVTLSNIEDGQYHDFKFNWVASTKTMTVSLDGNEIISYTRDIVADIFSGNNEVYYGFTAATGMATNLQIVWLESVCEGSSTTLPPEDGYTDPLDADGSGVVDYKNCLLYTSDAADDP